MCQVFVSQKDNISVIIIWYGRQQQNSKIKPRRAKKSFEDDTCHKGETLSRIFILSSSNAKMSSANKKLNMLINKGRFCKTIASVAF